MIEAEQTVRVDVPVDKAWDYIHDIRRWAELMPGYRACDVIDNDDSLWTMKVGAAGLVRKVNVRVHVEKWDEPGRVDFTYELEKEPVVGSGFYRAEASGSDSMQMTLGVRVKGSGPMAPMWEAVCKPLLPVMAKHFAKKLAERIEQEVANQA